MLIAFTTVANEVEGEFLARGILGAGLAACVQLLPKMRSFYYWDGELKDETEHLLLIKTLEAKFPLLERYICENHEYDVPELIAIESTEISDSYLAWINKTLDDRSST